jgi:Domain of unknown function (DUF4062)
MIRDTIVDSEIVIYAVFVSSTFKDLVTERQNVVSAVLSSGQFPLAMENFPAASQEAWGQIETKLLRSDYYVLVSAGRYGSSGEGDLSYTEREYDRAVELNLPILAFIHKELGELPSKFVEKDAVGARRLERFHKKVLERHSVAFWTTAEDLKFAVFQALSNAVSNNPRPGYRRLAKGTLEQAGFKSTVKANAMAPNERTANAAPQGELNRNKPMSVVPIGLRIVLDRRVLQGGKVHLEGLKKHLKPGGVGGRGGGEIRLVLELDDRERELEFVLPGKFDVSPMQRGVISTVPGVLEVVEI